MGAREKASSAHAGLAADMGWRAGVMPQVRRNFDRLWQGLCYAPIQNDITSDLLARRDVAQLGKLKHPGIVKLVEPFEETRTQVCLPAMSLRLCWSTCLFIGNGG